MDTLPTELIDDILGHAYYTFGSPDHTTLRSCALLCQAWSEPAQRLLFRHIILRGVYHGRGHLSFLHAVDPSTKRGRVLGDHVRVLEAFIGDKAGLDLDDSDLTQIIERTPRLYELVLRITGIHQFGEVTMDKLRTLAISEYTPTVGGIESARPVRLRALSILSCGIQSPVLYQLLSVWPSIEFLLLGVEIAAPPPRWVPQFKLYQLTLMRTPRLSIFSWLLSSSTDSLRVVSFRDAPGRELDPLLSQVGPRLRSLRLMNYSLRVASVLKHCPSIEEFVLVQMSTLFKLDNLPQSLEHLSCRNLPSEDQSLDLVIDAVANLQNLKVVTCDKRAREDTRIEELERLCASKGVVLYIDETPFWIREDPVYVKRFPKRKTVSNFALMN